MSELYDRIGRGYATQRRPDPRIYRQIRRRLEDVSSLINVGAGTGSYEPWDLPVVAVEPSAEMIAQRALRTNVVRAKAEALPFRDASVDASRAVLTVHHWQDRPLGLQECARAARRQVSILTWDPESDGFWLTREYFPELLAYDRRIFPGLGEIRSALGSVAVEPVLVPADCVDGFLGAYWRRPRAYLDPRVRSAMSSFARVTDVGDRLKALKSDLENGAWDRRHRQLLSTGELDLGYRLVTARLH